VALCKDELRFSDTTHLSWGWRDFIEHEDLHKDKYLKDDCLTVVCDITVTGLRADDHTAGVAAVRLARANWRSHLEQAKTRRED
jgi:hypothetical protein